MPKFLKPWAMMAALAVMTMMPAGPDAMRAQASEVPPKVFRLTLTGEGKVRAAPDMAIVSIGVWARRKTAAEALAANTKSMRAIFDALKSKWKMADKDMMTTDFSIAPAYEHYEKQPPRLVGYDVRNTLRLRVRELKKLGGILDEVVRLGANRVQGVQFTISNREELLKQARREAVKKARERAELYAEAAGLTLGPIVQLAEGRAHVPPPRPVMRRMAKMVVADSAAPVPVARGEQELRASVTITWEVWAK